MVYNVAIYVVVSQTGFWCNAYSFVDTLWLNPAFKICFSSLIPMQFCALWALLTLAILVLAKISSLRQKWSSFNFVGSFIPICALYDQLFNWTSARILCSFVDEFLLCFFDFLRENVKSLFQVIGSVLSICGLECREKLQICKTHMCKYAKCQYAKCDCANMKMCKMQLCKM